MDRTAATTTGALLLALVVSGIPAPASAGDQNGRDRRQAQTTRAQSGDQARSRRPDATADRGAGRQTRDASASQAPRREVAAPRAAPRAESNPRTSERQSVVRQSESRTVDARQSVAPRYSAPTTDRRQLAAPQYSAPTTARRQTAAPRYSAPTTDRRQLAAPQYSAPTTARRQTAVPRYDTRTLDRRQSVAPRYDGRAYTNRSYGSGAYSSRGGYDGRNWSDYWRYDGRRYIYSGYGYRPYLPRYNVRYGLGISIFAGRSFGFSFGYGWAPHYAYRFPIRTGIGYGGMSFLVDPDDAAIYVDGEFIGIASEFGGEPIPLAAGYHEVELQAEGCEPVVFDISVRPGQVIPYRGSLLAIR